MGLSKYYEKRDFKKTPEPRGRKHKSSRALSFVIQKHAASRLHYDFRLEMEGVLRSWAVPKGPSLDPAVKRLAMHVEDHPIEYGAFEGIIPKGQYGGGTVLLWDRGEWEPRGNPVEMYESGRLKFTLHGEKLQGGWSLVRMGGDGKSWLLVKERDDEAQPQDQFDVTEERPESVVGGRSIEQIAKDQDRVWNSNREEKVGKTINKAVKSRKTAPAGKAAEKPNPSKLKGAVKAAFPDDIEPQLATLVKQAPQTDDWIHEIKLDGYRMILYVDGKTVRFVSRNGNDWTGNYPVLVRQARELASKKVILDGEVVAFDDKGRTSFQILQNAQSRGAAGQLAYVAFDILYMDGYDVRRVAAVERKTLLKQLLDASPDADGEKIRYSEHFDESGDTVFRHACRFALEGIISKRKDAVYAGGRGRNWVKVKCISRQEFVIGGYTPPGGSRNDIGALLVGVKDKSGKLRFSGKVGTGFTAQTLRDLKQRFSKLHRDESPFVDPPRGAAFRGVQWLKPELVGEVEFTEWTDEGKLRHPSFQGLREDKTAEQVVEEKPKRLKENASKPRRKTSASVSAKKESRTKAPPAAKTEKAKPGARSSSAATEVAGVRLTSPDKIMYPEQGITKRDLAEYYIAVSRWILPHVGHRPLSLVRCPQGRGKCFYQKHADDSTPDVLERVQIVERDGPDTYLALDSTAGLVALVQMGVLEIHVWGSRVEKLEHPDQVVFDLDPDPSVSYKEVVEGALLLRDLLERAGLVPFVKTTGGKGLHVVVPLNAQNTWDEVKMFAELVASLVVTKYPNKYLAVASKAQRKGKIFIDYLRNGRGATAIAPYSTRAREGAPVSVPLAWEELTDGKIKPDTYNVRNIQDRLHALKNDPWKDFNKSRKKITAQVLKKLSA